MFTLGAGSETTASAIRFTMLHLISLPRAYNKLKQTVVTAVQGGLVSSPIRQEEAKKLPYLQVCSKNAPQKTSLMNTLGTRSRQVDPRLISLPFLSPRRSSTRVSACDPPSP